MASETDETTAPDGGPIYRASLLAGTMVTAATYDRLLAAYRALADLVPSALADQVAVLGKDTEAILRHYGITPTIEACDAFRIGLAHGLGRGNRDNGDDVKFGGSD